MTGAHRAEEQAPHVHATSHHHHPEQASAQPSLRLNTHPPSISPAAICLRSTKMPGANYMGGKRNAARARGKDATGKVQRSHFGKKRFEILRTGLSKGQASVGRATDQIIHLHNGPRWIRSSKYRTYWVYQPGRTVLILHGLIKRLHVLQVIDTRWDRITQMSPPASVHRVLRHLCHHARACKNRLEPCIHVIREARISYIAAVTL
ncbi:hypothetical protein VTO73DRAFT_8132 [Trametes versicolor]